MTLSGATIHAPSTNPLPRPFRPELFLRAGRALKQHHSRHRCRRAAVKDPAQFFLLRGASPPTGHHHTSPAARAGGRLLGTWVRRAEPAAGGTPSPQPIAHSAINRWPGRAEPVPLATSRHRLRATLVGTTSSTVWCPPLLQRPPAIFSFPATTYAVGTRNPIRCAHHCRAFRTPTISRPLATAVHHPHLSALAHELAARTPLRHLFLFESDV